jgi:hypothetical protein
MEEKVELLTEEVTQLIGTETKGVTTLPIQVTDIIRYCEATGNDNPLYTDSEYAAGTPYKGIIAPPTFYQAAFCLVPGTFKPVPRGANIEDIAQLAEKLPVKHALDTKQETRFMCPVLPGDTLTRRGKITAITEKQTKVGRGLFCTIENAITNQKGELVCTEVQEYFFY